MGRVAEPVEGQAELFVSVELAIDRKKNEGGRGLLQLL